MSGERSGDNTTALMQAISDQALGLEQATLVFLRTDQDGNLFTAIRVADDNTASRTFIPINGTEIDGANILAADRNGLNVIGFNYLFNGTSYDTQRNNTVETVLGSAARTASLTVDRTNFNAKGMHLIINVSSITDTPSITPTIQGKDNISGNFYDILVGNPITTTGIFVLKVYPGISAIVNAAASDILPRSWRIDMAHADTDSITYSISCTHVI